MQRLSSYPPPIGISNSLKIPSSSGTMGDRQVSLAGRTSIALQLVKLSTISELPLSASTLRGRSVSPITPETPRKPQTPYLPIHHRASNSREAPQEGKATFASQDTSAASTFMENPSSSLPEGIRFMLSKDFAPEEQINVTLEKADGEKETDLTIHIKPYTDESPADMFKNLEEALNHFIILSKKTGSLDAETLMNRCGLTLQKTGGF